MKYAKFLLALVLAVCFINTNSQAQKAIKDSEFNNFWKELQSAVKKGDKEKVAGFISFPLVNENDPNAKISKDQFIQHYSKIISKNISKQNSNKDIRGSKGEYTYEEWGTGMSNNCEYRINFKKVSGKYKAINIYLRTYDFENWNEVFKIKEKKSSVKDEFEVFFAEFKKALKKGDKKKVAEMVQFPQNSFFTNDGVQSFTKENFVKKFNQVFTKEMVAAFQYSTYNKDMNRTKKSDFQKLNKGNAEYVISVLNGNIEYAFYFTKINGKILLFESQFMGDTD